MDVTRQLMEVSETVCRNFNFNKLVFVKSKRYFSHSRSDIHFLVRHVTKDLYFY